MSKMLWTSLKTCFQFVVLGCVLRLPGVLCGNLALRQPTAQHSTFNNDASVGNSVDGSSSGNWPQQVCSSTSRWATDPWWRVDLGKSYLVDEVYILNRVDCCKERLHQFEIRIGDSLDNDGNSNPKCGDLHSMAAIEKKSFHCSPALRGRYVNIRIPGASKILTLCEVVVNPNPTENIALQRNAVHSSECCGGAPSRAVDGNFDGQWEHASCEHTVRQTDPWWRVDLGSSKSVSEVFIVNRVGVLEKLNNAELRVGDSLENNGNNNPRCGDVFSMVTDQKKMFYCKPRKTGRYVNIRLLGENQVLTLCEVAVYSESKAFLRGKPSQPTHVQVFDKSSLNLTCPEAFGFPAPHVAWIHNGSVLQNTTLLNLHLKSPPVPQDSVIDCVVSNKHGSDFHQFQLQFKSRFSMCTHFRDIRHNTREVHHKFADPSAAMNDSAIDEIEWVRLVDFYSGSPRQLPEHCVDPWRCGTQAPGWLQGQHPSKEENVVERTVCFSWNGNCCFAQTNILVRKCHGYYVYKLKATQFPVKARYCTVAAMTHSGEDVMFTSNAGQALEGHVIYKESNVREASSCMAYCLLEKSCTSFNYQPRENLCELNNATRLEDLQNFKQRPGSNYYEANENVVIMKSPL